MSRRTFCLIAPVLLIAGGARAQPQITSQASAAQSLSLELGEARLIRLSERVARISVSDPNVVDARTVTPLQVLVTAKAVGCTHLILWGENEQPLVIAATTQRNLSALRAQLKELFPTEEVRVSAAGDLVVLSGSVDDLRTPARMAEVARLHTKSLANLVQVSGDQQVQLEVRFAEVSRSGLRKMGVSFLWQDIARGHVGAITPAGAAAGQFLQIPATGASGGPPLVPAPVASDAFSLIFSTGTDEFPFSTILNILAQEGLAKVLAEPTLVALSGQEASFHAGGEVPVLVSQSFGQVSIQYKKFGVRLKFIPTVLGEKTISMRVAAEVSEPDSSVGVILAGFQVPGFRTRSSETTVRLRDGQSFAVAGLLSDNIRSVVKKIPLLGEIPVLGALFRSTAYQREESELMVMVTSHLVQPLQPAEVPTLPGENEINDPDDFQLFLMGRVGGWYRDARPAAAKSSDEHLLAAGQRRGSPELDSGPAGPIGFVRD